MKPVVTLIGRPNVGKSTLFNRITRTQDALVDDFPGVTRDRHHGEASHDGNDFILVDTGGYLGKDDDRFANEIRYQVLQAIEDSDAVAFVLDGKDGISPYDYDLVELLRNVDKPIFYLVNKIDNSHMEEKNLYDFYELGVGHILPVSGSHGYGVNDFLDQLIDVLPEHEELVVDEDVINVAVVGRPNVGKSSLVNQILGEKRLVVSDEAGTTRDSVDSMYEMEGKKYRLIDTAGIRRKGKVSHKIEKISVIKSLKRLDRCDVALILIDSSEGVTDQDITIAGYAYEKGCGCIFVLNKWDLVEKDHKTLKRFSENLCMKAKFLNFAPVVTISALTGKRVAKIFGQIDGVFTQYKARIGTGQLNKVLERALERTEPPLHKGKRLKFYYATQVTSKPPTLVLFVNYPEAVHFSYKRYLINQIREMIGLDMTPVRVYFRQRTGKIEFGDLKDGKQHSRNMGHKDKESKNKLRKRKERKIQSRKKLLRDDSSN